jgi:hypothetical protein
MTDIILPKGHSGVFGYGSLLLLDSMEATLGHEYGGTPYYCLLSGWRRTWDSVMPNTSFYTQQGDNRLYPENIIYLNVTSDARSVINGLVYELNDEDLQSFDAREWIYDRVDITDRLVDVAVSGGRVFMYVGAEPYLLSGQTNSKKTAIRKSYVNIVDRGLESLGASARLTYDASTQSLPESLVIEDFKDPGSHPFLAERRAQLR